MNNNILWGLDNPHPFSQMKTELIWEGKYDAYGKRMTVDIPDCDKRMILYQTSSRLSIRLYNGIYTL